MPSELDPTMEEAMARVISVAVALGGDRDDRDLTRGVEASSILDAAAIHTGIKRASIEDFIETQHENFHHSALSQGPCNASRSIAMTGFLFGFFCCKVAAEKEQVDGA